MGSYVRAGFIIGITLLTAISTTLIQQVYAAIEDGAQRGSTSSISKQSAKAVFGFGGGVDDRKAPIATSGDNNVYISWWSNKTGNDEVMFKASTNSGKTFGNKINLSNTPNADSINAEINAAGNNVYVSWWERNSTSNEPVLRISTDNGKSFGGMIRLSDK